jgi:ParB-like chromosome segregation protein Spo0J
MNDAPIRPSMPEAVVREYEFHPRAAMFPMIEGAEFEALVEDIRERGIIVPIVLADGKIIDGRNRYLAAKKAGHQFTAQDFRPAPPGADLQAFVISANIHRRQMNAKQKREFIAARIEAMPEASNAAIAKLACVDPKTVASVRDELEKRVATLAKQFRGLSAFRRRQFAEAVKRELAEASEFPSHA